MREHVTADVLSRLMRRALTDDEMIVALRHLDRCDDCAALAQEQIERELADLPRALGLDSVEPEPHLDAETQILPYVDGQLGPAELEIAESHLDDCDVCRAAVEAARARAARFRRASLGYAAAAVAAAVVVVIGIAQIDRDPEIARTAVTIPVVVTNTSDWKPPARQAPPSPRYANPEWETLVRRAEKTGELPFPADLAELRGTEDTLRGKEAPAVPPVSPAGVVIDETRPELTWPPREDATYVVSIFNLEEEVARSGNLQVTHWTPPRDLHRGRTYVWQVASESDGTVEILPSPPAPQAMFRITTERDHRELKEAKTKHPSDHRLLAVLYARSGMEKEALAEWEKLATNPHQSQ